MSDYYNTFHIITLYPTMAYFFFLFCKKYYKYILHYNLLVLDMYDNTYDYYNKDKETTDKQIQTDISYY
jgi:hypothetical protein